MTPSPRSGLYGGELVADLPAGSIIFLLDSPAAVDAMWAGHAPAVSPPLSAKGWLPEFTSQLAGHHVILIPSYGFPSSSAVRDRAWLKALSGRAASVKMTPPPGDGDLKDALTYIGHHSVADLVKWALEVAPDEPAHKNGKVSHEALTGLFSGRELATMDIPPIQWVVPGLLPEGCVLLAGRPKTGKSWLALLIALSVASEEGRVLGHEVLGSGSVLYFALEDTRARLRRRLDQLEPDRSRWPERLHFAEAAKPGPEGITAINSWCQQRADKKDPVRLIVVDTLGRMRNSPKANASVYHEDLEAIAPLHALAGRWHCVVILVDHQRKAAAEDIFDTVTGSLAKTGTVDGTWVLERLRGQNGAKLSITHRDMEETEMALEFDASRGLWSPMAGGVKAS
ncbi:MAG TPA: AAA family ATPase, partial [Candidatus Nanopelagicaceae bacterium]|nr:AAA family ATPase [Candidatus Nanopelagicaceae bacterium]